MSAKLTWPLAERANLVPGDSPFVMNAQGPTGLWDKRHMFKVGVAKGPHTTTGKPSRSFDPANPLSWPGTSLYLPPTRLGLGLNWLGLGYTEPSRAEPSLEWTVTQLISVGSRSFTKTKEQTSDLFLKHTHANDTMTTLAAGNSTDSAPACQK